MTGVLLLATIACADVGPGTKSSDEDISDRKHSEEESYRQMRERMVNIQIEARGIRNPRVLDAIRLIPRHRFLPSRLADRAYEDGALPIGEGQTISQPYIVARMTELLDPEPDAKILEIGTGSGYQAAVLSVLVDHVYSIEIVESLAEEASHRLEQMGYDNVTVRWADGYKGWPEQAPFDGIIVTAAPDHVPQPLVDQLKVGGELVIPIGRDEQHLMLLKKGPDGVSEKTVIPVRFVPMTGEADR